MQHFDLLEEKNPYLAFLLNSQPDRAMPIHFPEVSLLIEEDAQVVFIEGVLHCFKAILPFLERGGKVVFVERELERIGPFLKFSEYLEHEGIEIITDDPIGYQKIASKLTFLKAQFVGSLDSLKSWMNGMHLMLSDYRDFGGRILSNVVTNLLHLEEYVDGRSLEGAYLGRGVVICGSGNSLEKGLVQIRDQNLLVIAAGSAVPRVQKAGYSIDYGAFVDPNPPLEIYPEYFDFPLFYQNRVCQDLLAKAKKEKIWMGEAGGWPLEKWLLSESGVDPFVFDAGWNVGNFTLSIAYFLGANPIVLAGMDGGEKEGRPLKEGEFVVGGYITRRDLYEGILWMGEFIQAHPDREYIQVGEGISIPGCKREATFLNEKALKQVTLEKKMFSQQAFRKSLRKLQKDHFLELIEAYLHRPKEPILIELELINEPIYEFLLRPLWEKFEPLMEVPQDLLQKTIFQMLFFQKVLKAQTFSDGEREGVIHRFYENGALYGKERYRKGKKEGLFETYFEDGSKMSFVSYKNDLLEGDFILYSRDGVRREGRFLKGKKEGIHRLFNDEGALILESGFKEDVPMGKYALYHPSGILLEELIYHTSKKFDKRLFTDEGDLKYEGVFEGNLYRERRFFQGEVVSERMGQFTNGVIVWD